MPKQPAWIARSNMIASLIRLKKICSLIGRDFNLALVKHLPLGQSLDWKDIFIKIIRTMIVMTQLMNESKIGSYIRNSKNILKMYAWMRRRKLKFTYVCDTNASADSKILTCGDIGKRSKGFLGVYPCITSKGLALIDLLIELLYASWAIGRIESQFRLASPIRHQRRLPKLRLTTSFWPSIWGWNAVENFNLVPNKCHKVFQK